MSDKTILGRYQILDVLGRGAFSIVYRAVQIGVGRTVALKVFLLHPASTPDAKLAEAALVRFQREARLASQLRHPNTVTLYDYDRTDASILYMAFEYVEGPTLSRVIKDAPKGLSAARAIQVARQVALSLQEAHSQGIIHRDLKPGNIMLTRRQGQGDYVKVLDFGIAKVLGDSEEFDPQGRTDRTDDIAVLDLTGLGREEQAELTQDGRIVGTPRYIPPEQIHGSALSPAADLYALGLILHEMLTGVPANPGRKPQDLIRWHLEDHPFAVPAGFQYPAGLAHIIQKATRKAPTERYASCEAFLEELDRLDERGEWRKEQGRSKLLPVAVALNVVMLAALAVALYFVVQGERGPSQPNAALVPSTQPAASTGKPTPTPDAAPALDAGAPEVVALDAPSGSDVGVAQADAAPDAPAPLPAARTLEITSDPAGAEVWLGDLMLGQTPVEIALEDQPREMGLTLRKKGYQARTVTWRPNEPTSPFPVVLKRAANEGGGGGGNGNKYRVVP
jgi:tRNA A-37 threonylcarbamoyl transferase component Bud32